MPGTHGVELQGVDLGWTDRPVVALEHLAVRPGEHLGVTGPSGSGKSTLAATLVRFIDPVSGEVVLGGTDLRRLALHDVRRTVGLVDDDPHVFASTVAENIRLARPDATDEDVRSALDRARLGAWIDALPDGIHTHVGTGRREVSGGERARLALARSLLADPPNLVLDEPTAHLDGATARAVASEMIDSAARAGRSIVWITHGTVGLDAMDRVVRLDAGTVRGRQSADARPERSGRVNLNVLPVPSTDVTDRAPPWDSAMRCAIARPRPVPGIESASGLLERWNAENTCAWSVPEMPRPVSVTPTLTPRR